MGGNGRFSFFTLQVNNKTRKIKMTRRPPGHFIGLFFQYIEYPVTNICHWIIY